LSQVYKEITGGTESAAVNYSLAAENLDELTDHMNAAFERLQTRERKLGITLAGPHRDDLDFQVEGRSLRAFGSQGQQRSFLLAFKAAQVMDLEEKFREPPVLLLDDLASELDSKRQEGFFNFLLNRRGQVFLTSAQQSQLADKVQQTASFFKVNQGLVSATSPERG
jgi:DNA replication and repair protein RecF